MASSLDNHKYSSVVYVDLYDLFLTVTPDDSVGVCQQQNRLFLKTLDQIDVYLM